MAIKEHTFTTKKNGDSLKVWTIQPEEIYNEILKNGIYHCDEKLANISNFKSAYDWLVKQMAEKIGSAPDGVK